MSIATNRDVVRIAEADVALHRASVKAAWRGLKQEAERAATPGRVLGAGLATGFISGLRGSGSNGSGSAIGGKLIGMLLETVFASFTAAMAAGAAAANVEDGATAADPHPATDRG